jgi:hypothetical protein
MIDSLGHKLIDLICDIGRSLDFEVATEVEASASAWVDIVWFDPRLGPSKLGSSRPKIRRLPVLPVAGFEVEVKTGLNAKHIKGSVSNLNNLGALMGCIVLGSGNLAALSSKPPHTKKSPAELEKILLERAYRWVYAESQPAGRIVVMSESEVCAWATRLGVALPGAA